jgi:glycosyltransferase involved in cell wall biosynthesis
MTSMYVTIATRGRAGLLDRTLRSLAACQRPPSFSGTIVVENGDQQGAERVVRDAPACLKAVYTFHPEGNKSAALNAVLQPLGDDLVVFLDDDVLVGESLLTAYAAAAGEARRGVFLGGPVFADYETAPPDWIVDYLPPSARGWSLAPDTPVVTAPIFLGANWAAFVPDLRAAGGFDPALGPGASTGSVGQERSMQARLLRRGVSGKYVPDAEVWHWVPKERCSTNWAFRRIYRAGIRRGLDARMHEAVHVLGFPRWALRRAAERSLRALLCSLHPSDKVRADALRECLLSLGYLKGSRLTRGSGLTHPRPDVARR